MMVKVKAQNCTFPGGKRSFIAEEEEGRGGLRPKKEASIRNLRSVFLMSLHPGTGFFAALRSTRITT
jgi:hypothetical protein